LTDAYLSLGSNLGDRLTILRGAVAELAATAGIEVRAVSSLYETAPVGLREQPDFLNAAVKLRTSLEPEALLDRCLEIEQRFDRRREIRWGPRTLDVDIILYGQLSIDTERLTIPHPRARERAFVLVPLVEIEPEIRIEGARATDLLAGLQGDEAQAVRLYRADWLEQGLGVDD